MPQTECFSHSLHGDVNNAVFLVFFLGNLGVMWMHLDKGCAGDAKQTRYTRFRFVT